MRRRVYIMEHPASLLPGRSPQLRDVMDMDFRRLVRLLTGQPPSYQDDFRVFHNADEVLWWFDSVQPSRVALDLELDRTGQVDMVGLASSPTVARLLALPDPEGLTAVWDGVTKYQTEIVVHYGEGLEVPWLLQQFGPDIPFRVHDLHKIFHAYDCEYASAGRDKNDREEGGGSGALAFIQSLYTWRPYHKHLLKQAEHDFTLKAHYCMLDTVVTLEAFNRLEEVIQLNAPQAYEAYLRDAVTLLPLMSLMTQQGWLVDREMFKSRRKALLEQAKAGAEALEAVYGPEIRPQGKKAKTLVSVAGIKAVLQARGIKLPFAKNAKGQMVPSLTRESRQKLIEKHPELADLDAYWETQDILSDCYKPIMGSDGRCHAQWSGYLASWRWRCTHPNIAQWPESERDVFVASPGCVLVQFDTSAGEYRWFAGETGDPVLLETFAQYDASHDPQSHPHVANTAVLFEVPRSIAASWKSSADPTEKAKYTFSKNYIYRLMYSFEGGIDELRAAAAKAGLRFARKDIEEFDRVWFKKHPVAAEWRQRQARMAARNRIVVCREWGYTRILHGQDEAKIKNIALNFPMQAGIAGIINRTVREVWTAWRIVPLANMHDGLVYEVPKEKVDAFLPAVRDIMERPLRTLNGIRIPVDIKTGERWGRGLR